MVKDLKKFQALILAAGLFLAPSAVVATNTSMDSRVKAVTTNIDKMLDNQQITVESLLGYTSYGNALAHVKGGCGHSKADPHSKSHCKADFTKK